MGHNVTDDLTHENIPPWLADASRALVEDIVQTLAQREHDLLAVILFGSMARHEERPITDRAPSDVDLLAVFDTDDDPVLLPRGHDITHTIGLARTRHLDAPHEVQVMFATRTLREWDTTFIRNIAHDGLLLWLRGILPVSLAALTERQIPVPKAENVGKQVSMN